MASISLKFVFVLFLSLVFLFGCTAKTSTKTQTTAKTQPTTGQPSQISPAPNSSTETTKEKPAFEKPTQSYRILKVRVDPDTPGSRIAAASGQVFYNKIYLDLDNQRYIYSISDNSQAVIYYNGAYYKATVLAGKCFVSAIKQDFYKSLERDDAIGLGTFLLVESVKNKFSVNSTTNMTELVGKILQKNNDDSYTLLGLDNFKNNIFKKYGDLYLGSNVTFVTSAGLYTYFYSNVEFISKDDFDAVLKTEIQNRKDCKDVSGGPNPLTS